MLYDSLCIYYHYAAVQASCIFAFSEACLRRLHKRSRKSLQFLWAKVRCLQVFSSHRLAPILQPVCSADARSRNVARVCVSGGRCATAKLCIGYERDELTPLAIGQGVLFQSKRRSDS